MSWSTDDYCPIIHKDLTDIIIENTFDNVEYIYNVLGIYPGFSSDREDVAYIRIISYEHETYDGELTHEGIALRKEHFEAGFYEALGGFKVALRKEVHTCERLREEVKDSMSEICWLEYLKRGKDLAVCMRKIEPMRFEDFTKYPKLYNSRKKFKKDPK